MTFGWEAIAAKEVLNNPIITLCQKVSWLFVALWCQGLYSLSGKTSYRQISWSLESARLGVIMIESLCNLTSISAALLPRCLSNFRAIGKVQTRISRLRDLARSCGKTSYRLVNRGPGGWFNTKMSSYKYRKSHCGDKTVVRSSYLHNRILLSGVPDYFGRNKISSGGDLSHYSSASLH